MTLNEFCEYLNNSEDKRDMYISKAMSLIMTYFNKHKSKVPRDEKDDLFMDIIGESYHAYEQWEGEGYNEFCSYLYFKLMVWQTHILTKYHGIKISRNDLKKSKIEGRPIVLTKISYDEEGVM
ncbi:MAG: hypothetical protein ACRDDH_09200 [Cetobacterium sp.]|uniref:hypothetical protein n=1 Tax=Cetobacterium sp. TaxID=2071632 RepID=UPI003EE73A31